MNGRLNCKNKAAVSDFFRHSETRPKIPSALDEHAKHNEGE